MTITHSNADHPFQWSEINVIEDWIKNIESHFTVSFGNISFVYCSDHYLLDINKEYLDHDYYTDIITFDLSDDQDSAPIESEIYISIDRVIENANQFHSVPESELCRVMAHGLLHLIGYGDKTPEEQTIMRSKEDTCLSLLTDVPRGTFN